MRVCGCAGIRLGRLKKDGVSGKSGGKASVVFGESEIESLRSSIQIMCQSTNPLGKCMDYVHEDLAVMNKEYDRWQAEYRGKLDALEDQKRVRTHHLPRGDEAQCVTWDVVCVGVWVCVR